MLLAVLFAIGQAIISLDFVMDNWNFVYTTNISAGTPPQQVTCVLDTGTSDFLIVNSTRYNGPYFVESLVNLATSDVTYKRVLHDGMPYRPDESATLGNMTLEDSQASFEIKGWNADSAFGGLWMTDDFRIGELSLVGAVFGLVSRKNYTNCVIGLGPVSGEIAAKFMENGVLFPTYNNTPNLGLSQIGDKNVSGYSIWVEPPSSGQTPSKGTIMFGGYDPYKLSGLIYMIPMISIATTSNNEEIYDGEPMEVRVILHAVSAMFDESQDVTPSDSMLNTLNATDVYTQSNGTSTFEQPLYEAVRYEQPVAVQLNTGLHLSYIPRDVVRELGVAFGLTPIANGTGYAGVCDPQGYVRLNFSGVPITIPAQDLMIPDPEGNISGFKLSDGTNACFLSLVGKDSPQYMLGNGILRHLYMCANCQQRVVGLGIPNVHENYTSTSRAFLNFSDTQIATQAPLYSATTLARSGNYTATWFRNSTPQSTTSASVIKNGGSRIYLPVCTVFAVILHLLM